MRTLLLLLITFNAICLISSEITISLLTGEKLFNTNTPLILNLETEDTNAKKSSVDLVCVIDVSGSMTGKKIQLVKESLKTMISMMDENDKIGLVLFNSKAEKLLDLTNASPSNKVIINDKIDSIRANGGTSILTGLSIGIDMLKGEQWLTRTTSMILLSDGMDNNLNEVELANGLKDLTKGSGLSFTLHTFGYGNDHDPLIMNKLAKLRDGSFYFVEELGKVKHYFVNVLGGCMSVISKQVKLTVHSKFIIKKVFGLEDLYTYELSNTDFSTEILQFISGKEYTYVFETEIPEDIIDETQLFEVKLKYTDLNGKENEQKEILLYSKKKEGDEKEEKQRTKANEEYIRSVTYDTIEQAVDKREKGQKKEAKEQLEKMDKWIKDNYKGTASLSADIAKSINYIGQDKLYKSQGRASLMASVSEKLMKRGGNEMAYSNSIQNMMLASI